MLDAYIIDRLKREKEGKEISQRPHVESPEPARPDYEPARHETGGHDRGIEDITNNGRIQIGEVLDNLL